MSMIPQYQTKLFSEVFENENEFITGFNGSPLGNVLDSDKIKVLYYLLYAKYGNNPIANLDENQFKYKLYGIIWSYGPAWAKRVEIQEKIRALKEEDLRTGSKQVSNHAFNPSSEPSTSSLEELNQINDQSTVNYKKSKLEAYGALWDLISTDVTTAFIDKFKICFKTVVAPEQPLLYVSEGEN